MRLQILSSINLHKDQTFVSNKIFLNSSCIHHKETKASQQQKLFGESPVIAMVSSTVSALQNAHHAKLHSSKLLYLIVQQQSQFFHNSSWEFCNIPCCDLWSHNLANQLLWKNHTKKVAQKTSQDCNHALLLDLCYCMLTFWFQMHHIFLLACFHDCFS